MYNADCVNAYGDDMLCSFWAITGECVRDADFMMKYCHKACSRCDVDAIGLSSTQNIIIISVYLWMPNTAT